MDTMAGTQRLFPTQARLISLEDPSTLMYLPHSNMPIFAIVISLYIILACHRRGQGRLTALLSSLHALVIWPCAHIIPLHCSETDSYPP